MANLFQNLELQAFRAGITPRTKESRDWFRKKAQGLRRINRDKLADSQKKTGRQIVGNMYMFFYDPKHKQTLPYYDKFPLAIVVGPAPGGFYGLNLHYLPPTLRARFLDELLDIASNKAYDEDTKFKVSYALLNRATKFRYFKPCFKHYLTKHVQSQFSLVEAPEWEIATFLPTASWEKASAAEVYKESRKMVR
jgi:hypothetical protein